MSNKDQYKLAVWGFLIGISISQLFYKCPDIPQDLSMIVLLLLLIDDSGLGGYIKKHMNRGKNNSDRETFYR